MVVLKLNCNFPLSSRIKVLYYLGARPCGLCTARMDKGEVSCQHLAAFNGVACKAEDIMDTVHFVDARMVADVLSKCFAPRHVHALCFGL